MARPVHPRGATILAAIHRHARLPHLRDAALGAALAAVVMLGAACNKTPEAPPAPAAPPTGAGLPVTVIVAKMHRVPDVIEAVGQTEGSKDVEVRARVSGIIEKQLYREGERIKAGTPLFQIERAPFENALAQAQASVAQERARLEQTRREGGRLKQLVEEKAISLREYDDATTNQKTAEATIAAAQARVKDAELNLSYTQINAPIGGISGRALRSIGSLVTAGTESALLTTVSQSEPIWVRFSVSESEYAQVRAAKKTEARLVLGDGSNYPQPGRLNFTASSIDAKLGTIQLRAEFPNPALALLPGQFVRVRLTAGESEAILVPQSAVVQNDQGRFVWVAGADGKAVMKPIETANWVGRDWLVKKGLAAGDRVIVDNLLKLRPGAPVQPQTPVPSGAMPLPSLSDKGGASSPASAAPSAAPSTSAAAGAAGTSSAAGTAGPSSTSGTAGAASTVGAAGTSSTVGTAGTSSTVGSAGAAPTK